MLQRPGCFVFYVLAAFVGLAMFINWVNDTRAASATFSDGQQNVAATVALATPTASATTIMTATPNANETDAASGKATMDAANTASAHDQATQDTGTRIAQTQTPAAWTAEAVDVEQQHAAAARDKTLLEAQLLAGTITAAPTSQWKTEVAVWPTIEAQMTQAKDAQIMADNARWWGHVAADAWSLVLVAIPVSVIIALIVSSIVMPNAFSWRVQGVSGGQAQAAVEAAQSIPGKKGGKPHELIKDEERAKLIEFVEACRRISGDGSTMITPQSQFGSDAGWDGFVKQLKWLGLVKTKPGNEGGTRIAGGRTLVQLADVLREGTEE